MAIARAQADALSAYVAEERRLSDQRRGELAVRERELSERMAELVATVEQRVEERLRTWEADLERAQNALQGAVSTLEQRMRQRIADVESKVGSESDELDAAIDEQRTAAARLREELESSARDASHTRSRSCSAGRRPSPNDRRAERAPATARARRHRAGRPRRERDPHADLVTFAEIERRAGGAARAGDHARSTRAARPERSSSSRMRAIREEAAQRLREELDRTADGFLRRADGLVAAELQQAMNAASQRLDDRIVELARQYAARASVDA